MFRLHNLIWLKIGYFTWCFLKYAGLSLLLAVLSLSLLHNIFFCILGQVPCLWTLQVMEYHISSFLQHLQLMPPSWRHPLIKGETIASSSCGSEVILDFEKQLKKSFKFAVARLFLWSRKKRVYQRPKGRRRRKRKRTKMKLR